MKSPSLILTIPLGLVLLLVILAALLPAIASLDGVRPLVLREINRHLPGQVQVENWSLGWLGGMRFRGVVYDSRPDDLNVRVAEIGTDKGFLGLALSGGNLGPVRVLEPVAVFGISGRPEPAAPRPEGGPGASRKGTVPGLFARVSVTGGSILTHDGAGTRTVVRDLDLDLDASGLDRPLTYRFSALSGDKQGRASGEGKLLPDAADPLNARKIQWEAKVSVQDWEIREGAALLASRAGIPSASGRLSTEAEVTGSLAGTLQVSGRLSIPDLQMRGGPLGPDTPAVRDLALDLEGSGSGGAFEIRDLTFRSSLAKGSASGVLDGEGRRLSVKADVDLAEVFAQLPAT
ncbi:MAG: DUF748 domain-containing protein, partial [Deltaproteobacteria bacterium]|nr:DUF748 domain-containing protein [Deltaproteobacteria bacterium]